KNIVLSLIRDLYKAKKEHKPADQTLEKLKSYLDYIVINKLPKSNLVSASNYAIKQWQDIQRIFQKDEYQPDNNAIERQIRYIAVGRKNWLFAGSHNGAKAAGILYTIFNSARIHK